MGKRETPIMEIHRTIISAAVRIIERAREQMSVLRLTPVIAICVASGAHASSQTNGYISEVDADRNVVVFFTNGTRSAMPSCATAGNRWAIDISTDGGKIIVSTLLTALSQGRLVTVLGTGTCSAVTADELVETLTVS